jgi:hypothetical protein
MAKLNLRRTLAGFAAADEESADAIKRYPLGGVFRADVVKPRDHKNNNRWWKLCELVRDNTEGYASKEQVSDHIKILCGHTTTVGSKATGELYHLPNSISFSALDEIEFYTVWKRAIQAVDEHIIPGIGEDEIKHEVEKLIGLAA